MSRNTVYPKFQVDIINGITKKQNKNIVEIQMLIGYKIAGEFKRFVDFC